MRKHTHGHTHTHKHTQTHTHTQKHAHTNTRTHKHTHHSHLFSLQGDFTAAEYKVWVQLFEHEPKPLSADEKTAHLKTLNGVSVSNAHTHIHTYTHTHIHTHEPVGIIATAK